MGRAFAQAKAEWVYNLHILGLRGAVFSAATLSAHGNSGPSSVTLAVVNLLWTSLHMGYGLERYIMCRDGSDFWPACCSAWPRTCYRSAFFI